MENKILKHNNRTNISNSMNRLSFDFNNKISKKNINNETLDLNNGVISAHRGNEMNQLNENSISAIAQSYLEFIKNKGINNIFVAHDGDFNSLVFAKIFASILKSENINVFINQKNQAISIALSNWIAMKSNKKIKHVIYFSNIDNNAKYNILFFKRNGILFDEEMSNNINLFKDNTNYLILDIPEMDIPEIENDSIQEYINNITCENKIENISIAYTNYFNFNYEHVELFFKSNITKSNLIKIRKKIKSNENAITRKSILNNLFKKTDCIINFKNKNGDFEFIVKHKKRWKFFSYNELSIIYLDYLKNTKENISLKNKFIYTTDTSSDFIHYYAKNLIKNCIQIDSQILNEKNADLKNLLLATNGIDYFITKENKTYCNDNLLNLKVFFEVLSFYKKQNKSLYDVLIDIYRSNQIYRHSIKEEILSFEMSERFFLRIKNMDSISGIKILKKEKNTNNKFIRKIKLYLENKSIIILEYNKENKKLKIFFSLWSKNSNILEQKKEDEFIDLILLEKKLYDSIRDLIIDFRVQKFSWKSFIKYFLFICLFVFLFYFVFNFIFDSNKGLFLQITQLFKKEKLFSLFLPWILMLGFVNIFINSWTNKRMMTQLNEKVKLRYLLIAQFMGFSISTITPMFFGGESIGYWYLRRKNVNKSAIAATYLVQAFLFQINIIIFSLIFFPLAFIKFLLPIWSSNLQATTIVVLVIIGFCIDIFSAIMIGLLTFNKKIQRSLGKTLNKFIEWIPFIITRDSGATSAKLQYDFLNINIAAKKIFNKGNIINNIILFLEFIGYRALILLIDCSLLTALFANMLKENNIFGYLDMIAGNTLIRNINAINFITPSGLVIQDWAKENILSIMFIDGSNSTNINHFKNVRVYLALERLLFTVFWVVLSALMIISIYVIEIRIDKYMKIRNFLTEDEIKQNNVKIKTNSYKSIIAIWCLFSALTISSWYLSYFYLIL